jgi:O-antigen ligase
VVLEVTVGVTGEVAALLGRDPTFSGRTHIWARLLEERTNPLFGVGFSSFWLGERVARLSASYHYELNEAHNGYLEMYLNAGLIGVALLLFFLYSSFRRAQAQFAAGEPLGNLRFAFTVSVAIYALTEAIFNRLGIIWFTLLLLNIVPPQSLSRNFKRCGRSHRTEKVPGETLIAKSAISIS